MQTSTASNAAVAPPHCGDGYVDIDEECDDGGRKNGDGCSKICKDEGKALAMECEHGRACRLCSTAICWQAFVAMAPLVLGRSVMMATLPVATAALPPALMKVE